MKRALLAAALSIPVSTQVASQPLIGGNLESSETLVSVDRDTAQTTVISAVDLMPVGLAFDPLTRTLYIVDDRADTLFKIDEASGDAIPITTLDYEDPNSLAFDPQRGLLYGTDGETRALFTIDPTSGKVAEIGVIGPLINVEGLAFDPATETLYALIEGEKDAVVILDRDSAVIDSVVLELRHANWLGLAHDPARSALFLSVASRGPLYRIDDLNGEPALTKVGLIEPAEAVHGLAFAAPTLIVTGHCPGTIETCMVAGLPGDLCAVVYGIAIGPGPRVPGCAGLNFDIPNLHIAAAGFADDRGHFCATGMIPGFACSRVHVQGVNVSRCVTSGVWTIR